MRSDSCAILSPLGMRFLQAPSWLQPLVKCPGRAYRLLLRAPCPRILIKLWGHQTVNRQASSCQDKKTFFFRAHTLPRMQKRNFILTVFNRLGWLLGWFLGWLLG